MNLLLGTNDTSAKSNETSSISFESTSTAATSEQVVEVVEVNQVSSSPANVVECVTDEMVVEDVIAYEDVEAYNPDQDPVQRSAVVEVVAANQVLSSTTHIVESVPETMVDDVKTYVDVGTQTEPFVWSPVAETILTPRRKRKLVTQDHAYCKKKLEMPPVQPEPSLIPKTDATQDVKQEPETSDDEWEDDVGDAGTDYNSDTSDEDWVPDDEDIESDDENPAMYRKSETNWLQESEELYKENKSIVFDSHLRQLFQRCQKCGAHVKFASLEQRGSLIGVTSSCQGGHTETWFSQPFNKKNGNRKSCLQ